MRIFYIVIFIFIVSHPFTVMSEKKQKETKEKLPCGKKYMYEVNGKCYYFAIKKMNWFGALNNCLRKGLTLADLATAEDFDAVTKFLRERGNMEDFWFGGNDLQTEGRFTYISSGLSVKYFSDNKVVEPTHRSNLDDCLELRLRDAVTVVTDENCQEKQYFVCEQHPEMKCKIPGPPDSANTGEHHSHEHLHHFHHDVKDTSTGDKEEDELTEEPIGGNAAPPAEGETPPEEGEISSIEGETPSAEGETPPEEGEAPPAEVEAPPAEGEAPPAEVEAPPTEGEAPPTEGEAPPAESEAPPTEGEAPPAEGEAPPAEDEAPPAEGEAPAAEGEAPPAEGEAPPAAGGQEDAAAPGEGAAQGAEAPAPAGEEGAAPAAEAAAPPGQEDAVPAPAEGAAPAAETPAAAGEEGAAPAAPAE